MPLLLIVILAHINGVPTRAAFTNPTGLGVQADQSIQITWTDPNDDPTGLFDFYFQESNTTPNAMLTPVLHPSIDGAPISGASDIESQNTTNGFTWNTASMPSGSYFVYEITTDKDQGIPPALSVTKAPITIRHAGDPLFPAVVVDEPNGIGDVVESDFAIKWRATGEGTLTADLWAYNPDDTEDVQVIAEDVPMYRQADGTYAGCHVWDLGATPAPYYYVEVRVSDDGGRTHRAYSPGSVAYYSPPPDPGAVQECPDLSSYDPGPGDDDPDAPQMCACHVGGAAATLPGLGSVVLGLALAASSLLLRRHTG